MDSKMRIERLGKLTASKAAVTMGDLKTKGLRDYVVSLAFERIFGDPQEDGYRSRAMERGNEMEPRAIEWYCFENSCIVKPGGIVIDHPTIPFVSATPDAMREDRCIEAKSLLHKAWAEACEEREVPSEHRWQCRWQQWCAEVGLCDYVVWHPIGGGFVIPTKVSKKEIDQMTERAFLVEEMIKEKVAVLRERMKL